MCFVLTKAFSSPQNFVLQIDVKGKCKCNAVQWALVAFEIVLLHIIKWYVCKYNVCIVGYEFQSEKICNIAYCNCNFISFSIFDSWHKPLCNPSWMRCILNASGFSVLLSGILSNAHEDSFPWLDIRFFCIYQQIFVWLSVAWHIECIHRFAI